ncbi:glycosyltransferase involved in cell wall biosynthesis [Solirubrobacter pauli]|uniref:Glycosyltransferase involved in cell wall biosynthesis n=1 Tax=Solirubrobacter pauli TaxID=166793 RepID=A0A660LK89_9ACTN|nr:glycosyltransferase [Solirubrobacter pauli]RKQ93904.1 glycosyltransferase involved in cell wall biosynthesis [Solirubrobacter pauli]
MRVAMVSEHASPLAVLGGVDAGGQNVHVAALATALARLGDRVVVHTRRDDAGLPRRVRLARGVEVDHVDAGPPTEVPKDELLQYMGAFADDLREQWLADPPDVVHAHFWMSGLAAIAAAQELGIPVVHTFHALGTVKRRHQGDRDTSPPTRIADEARIARTVDRVVATCSDEVFELLRMGADGRRITVVPCGVDLDRFTPDGPAEPRDATGTDGVHATVDTPPHRLVAACRLVERKGLADVITALADIPDAELHVAGGPEASALEADPEARRLRALAADLGVEDRLILRGRVGRAAMPALLRSADAVVCAPWYEPFGIVPLEAMACGVPVIATAVGGQTDSVVHGVTGVHVPPRDPGALARAANALLRDADRRREYGRDGASRARLRFGFDRIARSTRDVYAPLVARETRRTVVR